MIPQVLIAIIVVICLYKFFQKERINLPGPTPWPVIGNIFQVSTQRPHDTFDKWHSKYGRVFRFYQLGNPVIVVGSYEGMHEVLIAKGKDFSGRFPTYRLGLWSESHHWRDGIIFAPPDKSWKMLRMTAQKRVKQFDDGMKKIEMVGNEICEDLVDNITSQQGAPFRPGEYITNAVMNNLTVFLLGKKFSTHDVLFRQFFEMETLTMEVFSPIGPHALIDIFPWLRFLGSKTVELFKGVVRKRNELFTEMTKQLLVNTSEMSDRDRPLLESFLKLTPDPSFEGGETRVKCASMNIIFAGTGTSTSSLIAFVNIITHYRTVYGKLQAEIDDVLGSRPPRFEDRDNMPYMRATILELLRFSSVVLFSVPHNTIKDTTLHGAFIPKGTMVLVNLWSCLHDPSYWPEPYEFRPERFLDDAGQVVPADHENRKRLMPFGAGPRVCIGEQFALGRLFLMMTCMLQRFDIEQPEPKVSCDPREYKMAVVLTPPDIKVTMTPRKVVE